MVEDAMHRIAVVGVANFGHVKLQAHYGGARGGSA